jgi:hypothetical protein
MRIYLYVSPSLSPSLSLSLYDKVPNVLFEYMNTIVIGQTYEVQVGVQTLFNDCASLATGPVVDERVSRSHGVRSQTIDLY